MIFDSDVVGIVDGDRGKTVGAVETCSTADEIFMVGAKVGPSSERVGAPVYSAVLSGVVSPVVAVVGLAV